jgi:hypothetical protein
MSTLRDEIVSRFPELVDRLDDEDGDYTLMNRLAEWLRSMTRSSFSNEMVARLRSFKEWCETQPPTGSAEDDIYTIFIVGFWEHLFEADCTRYLIPQLMTREEVTANRDYLTSWVGAENYQMALDEYDRTV